MRPRSSKAFTVLRVADRGRMTSLSLSLRSNGSPPCKSVVLWVLIGAQSRAQETIFNVPSGDVLHRGTVYGELDFT